MVMLAAAALRSKTGQRITGRLRKRAEDEASKFVEKQGTKLARKARAKLARIAKRKRPTRSGPRW